MSTETVLYAVTTVQRRLTQSDLYSPDSKRGIVLSTDLMRDALKAEDAEAFNATVDRGLARFPDRYAAILDELFAELKITDRDQLTAILNDQE